MAKKDFTLTSKVLMSLLAAGDMVLVTPHELRKRLWNGQPLGDNKNFYKIVHYLAQKGWIKRVDKDNERFIKLTRQGQLEGLLAKARVPKKRTGWDGKWQVFMYDIPEGSKEKRDFFRWLLKKHGYKKLQHSVYINPMPLNEEAMEYLVVTGLIKYVRIMKVEEMDSDKELRRMFKLGS